MSSRRRGLQSVIELMRSMLYRNGLEGVGLQVQEQDFNATQAVIAAEEGELHYL